MLTDPWIVRFFIPSYSSIQRRRYNRSRLSFSDMSSGAGTEVTDLGTGGGDASPDQAPSSSPPSSTNGSTSSPALSRSHSFSSSFKDEDWEGLAQLDRITFFDLLDNLALPSLALNQRIEKWNKSLQTQSENFKKRSSYVKETYAKQKEKVVKRKDIEVERFKKRYGDSIDKLMLRWEDQKVVTAREKLAFVVGVSNIFLIAYLIGGHPQLIHVWYTVQMCYFMPLRYITYHKRGYHYFLADLCYFVNLMLLVSIWVFPRSRRLFISTYCLAYGNNAWAIAMWRNSLVFHSLDKVTSLFIHLMPPVVLHCIVHLDSMKGNYYAVDRMKKEGPFTLAQMIIWATIPYAVWQTAYHVFITIRRKDKIAAGRPTSFTWLKKSYAKTFLGRLVLKLPEKFQTFAFMAIQYIYAVITMLPVPLWYRSRLLSSALLIVLALLSVYNGATFYIDVFGKRFEKELEKLKKDMEKWQASPNGSMGGGLSPNGDVKELNLQDGSSASTGSDVKFDLGANKEYDYNDSELKERKNVAGATGVETIKDE